MKNKKTERTPDGNAPVFLEESTRRTNPSLETPVQYVSEEWEMSWNLENFIFDAYFQIRYDIQNYLGIATISCVQKLFKSIVNDKNNQQVK